MKIYWQFQSDHEKFAENLTSNDGIVIVRASSKISTLGIEAVKARHRGNYTCTVQNRAGIASHSAYLAINGQNTSLLKTFPVSFAIYFPCSFQ